MRSRRIVVVLSGICFLAPLPVRAQPGPEVQVTGSAVVLNLDGAVPAESIDDIRLQWFTPAYSREGGRVNSVQCLATARDRGRLERGMSLELRGEISDRQGNLLRSLSTKIRPLNPVARFAWDFPDFSSQQTAVEILVEGGLEGDPVLDWMELMCRAMNRKRCQESPSTACVIGNKRFKVQVDFGPESGVVTERIRHGAVFRHPDSSRDDVLVDLSDKCVRNDHFWVGIGSLTARPFTVVIEDLLTGKVLRFSSPGAPGTVAVRTDAFATCP